MVREERKYMSDFSFLENPFTHKWIVWAPKRSSRPDEGKHTLTPICPFCPGREGDEEEIYRVGGTYPDANWQIRVIPNKFAFAPVHEIIIHSQDHHKDFGEAPREVSELVLKTFRQRYQTHSGEGTVYLFHNHGEASGESLPHPHSQIVVIPSYVSLEIPSLEIAEGDVQETNHFTLFCPTTSYWPDEVWITPKKSSTSFGEISDAEISNLAFVLQRLIDIMGLRHGHEFPFNFYISPWKNWYLRLIPRVRRLGGFEIGTNISVNTQDPKETIAFIKEHFLSPNRGKITLYHQAEYRKAV